MTSDSYKLLLLLLLAGVAGCARLRPEKGQSQATTPPPGNFGALPTERPKNQGLIVTPATALVGKVAMVNNPARFVVLSFPIGNMPATDQHLDVYRSGLKVGELKVTGPQQDDNVVADIIAGESEVGDVVRDK